MTSVINIHNKKLLCKVYTVPEKLEIMRKLSDGHIEHICRARGTNQWLPKHIFWFCIYIRKEDYLLARRILQKGDNQDRTKSMEHG